MQLLCYASDVRDFKDETLMRQTRKALIFYASHRHDFNTSTPQRSTNIASLLNDEYAQLSF